MVFQHHENGFSFGSSEQKGNTFDEEEGPNAKSSYELTSHISDEHCHHRNLQHSFLINPGVKLVDSHNNETSQSPDPNDRFSRSPDIPIVRFQRPRPFSTTSQYFPRTHSQSTWVTSDFELTPIESLRQGLQIPEESEAGSIQPSEPVNCQHEISEYRATFPVVTPPESNDFTQIRHQNRSFSHVGALARSYQVYNDEISPSTQPQTPANLPESRHKSRHHPSFSMPTKLFRRNRRTYSIDAVNATGRHYRQGTSSSHSPGNGTISPSEMAESGDGDLFGGRENEDEELNWVQGMRLYNPRVRLWRQEDSGSNERELDRTPESESRTISREF
ncbi:unnamed protein product [Blumeria hordei]|uniref:Uncharacterized protein n=1 Tax=Blumeria hordei TaxID=2867405 RepID=A0A383V3P8_BLUHO|nr:unnamed protein product [Blumeria hordei]